MSYEPQRMGDPFGARQPDGGGGDDSRYTFWLILSILSAFFCCQPLGIVAAVFGVLAYLDHSNGRHAAAEKKLHYTINFTILAAVLLVLVVLVAFCFGIGGMGTRSPMSSM